MGALPFSDFLELLRTKGLGVGLHEHLAAGKLLARWDSTSRDDFRDALAALLARNDAEVQEIRDLFDEFYPADDRGAEVAVAAGAKEREYRRIRLIRDGRVWGTAVGALAAAVLVAFGYQYYYATPSLPGLPAAPRLEASGPRPPTVPPPDPPPGQPVDPPIREDAFRDINLQFEPEPPPAELEPPPSRVNWPWVIVLSAAALVVSLLGFWGADMRARARQWTIDAWRSTLAALPGPYHASLVLKDAITRLPRSDIEDAATLLARAFAGMGRSRALDVQRSLKDTLRFGMRPVLVFRPRRLQQTILVLRDVSQLMRPHAARVDSLLADLRRQGIVIETWYFDGDISVAHARPGGPPIPLDMLARRREDWPLMIIGTGFEVAATLQLPHQTWMKAFRTWTRRVWLSPIPDPELWPAALRRLPIPVMPMTRSGLLQAARILAQGEYASEGTFDRTWQPARPVTVAQVEKLRQLASIVPEPTVTELELLRQRFAPEIPARAVFHVAEDMSAYAGAPIQMSAGEIRDRLRQLRAESPGLEIEVRRYLLKVLADSEPVPGSAAHARWEISRALHRAEIAELGGGDARPALAELAALANGPLWRELREAVRRLPAEPTPQHAEIRKAVGLQHRREEPPAFHSSGQLEVQPFRWSAPRWQDVVLAAGIAFVIAGAGSLTAGFRLQASHALDAYTLEYQPSPDSPAGMLRVALRDPESDVPRTVRLYRNMTLTGNAISLEPGGSATVPLTAGTGPQLYQARAELDAGAYALSNTLWAPSVVIVIDAQPWARVTIRSKDGTVPEMTHVTPAAVRLPEGTYTLSFENGGLTDPLSEEIQVSTSGRRIFRYDMPEFDPAELLDRLGVGAPPAAAAQ